MINDIKTNPSSFHLNCATYLQNRSFHGNLSTQQIAHFAILHFFPISHLFHMCVSKTVNPLKHELILEIKLCLADIIHILLFNIYENP
jgi:hypothetical protein